MDEFLGTSNYQHHMLTTEKPRPRTRTSHPGVKLLRRVRVTGTVWLARWVDPDTGRAKEVTLARLGLTSDESRVGWCATNSRTILQRRADLVSGAALVSTTAVADAISTFAGGNLKLAATLGGTACSAHMAGPRGFCIQMSRGVPPGATNPENFPPNGSRSWRRPACAYFTRSPCLYSCSSTPLGP